MIWARMTSHDDTVAVFLSHKSLCMTNVHSAYEKNLTRAVNNGINDYFGLERYTSGTDDPVKLLYCIAGFYKSILNCVTTFNCDSHGPSSYLEPCLCFVDYVKVKK